MKTKGVGILTYQADRDNLRRHAGDWHEGVRTAAGGPPAANTAAVWSWRMTGVSSGKNACEKYSAKVA